MLQSKMTCIHVTGVSGVDMVACTIPLCTTLAVSAS